MILLLAVLIQAAPPPPPGPPPPPLGDVTCPDGALVRSGETCPAPSPGGLEQFCIDGTQVRATEACPPSRVLRVFFDSAKAEISRDGQSVILEAAAAWRRARPILVVEGHSDRSGPAAANRRSGEQRALAAKAALVASGVDPTFIRTASAGEDKPLIATADGVREPQNRRVDISFQRP